MNKNIKILIPIFYPVGGIRSYIKYTMGKLDNNVYEFTLLSTQQKSIDTIKHDLSDHIVHTIISKRKDNKTDFAISILKALVKNKYDIIHSQGYTAGIITCLVNNIFRTPHIITLHHVFNADQYSDKIWERYGSIRKNIIGNILMQADYIQAVSNDAKENILEHFPMMADKYRNMIVIMNGVDTKTLLNTNNSNDKYNIKEEGKIVIGFLGRYMPEKGFDYIIKAVDKLVYENNINNIKIATVGGFGGFIREYKKEIERRGLQSFFHFHDFVENVGDIMRQFDVLIIPSLGEACGLVPMEALVCGIPVIAFSSIGLREVLNDTPAIMVELKNINALTNAIMHFINNRESIKPIFEKYIPIAVRRYNSENSVKILENYYNLLLK